MEYIIVKTIPKDKLKEYKNYIGFLFKNQDGVYNICDTEEDITKSNQWFNNYPVHSIVVERADKVVVGDKILPICVNIELNGKTFTYNGDADTGVDLVSLTDKDGNEVITTIFILKDVYKVLRKTNRTDKEKLINGKITPMLNLLDLNYNKDEKLSKRV